MAKRLQHEIDFAKLQEYCESSISDVLAKTEVRGKKGKQHGFIDNGSDILAVCHLDTVQQGNHFEVAKLEKETLIFNPKLDDRLGVYTILDLLPKLGIKLDILLTENEESGQSTASDFIAEKEYNWIVEFDRKGEGAVLYQFDDWENTVEKYFEIGHGSFSDITDLDELGCCAINIGIGYHDCHSSRAFCVLEEYYLQISRFLEFYEENKNTAYPHSPENRTHGFPFGEYDYYGKEYDYHGKEYYCQSCNELFLENELFGPIHGEYICEICGNAVSEFDEDKEWEENEELKKAI